MAKETNPGPKNNNLGSFVDAVTPEPKIVQDNFIQFDKLNEYLSKTPLTSERSLIERMIDMVLDCSVQEKFLSLGEQYAFNTLRKLQIIV